MICHRSTLSPVHIRDISEGSGYLEMHKSFARSSDAVSDRAESMGDGIESDGSREILHAAFKAFRTSSKPKIYLQITHIL